MLMNAPVIRTRPPVRRQRSKLNRQRIEKHRHKMIFAGFDAFFVVVGGLSGILIASLIIHKFSPGNPVSKSVRATVGKVFGEGR